MASIALDPAYRRISVEEFLDMDFHGAKAELEDGLIYMMAGGSETHARIASDILVATRVELRGTGCRPYGSDLATRTGERSIRFPDVSIYCDILRSPENANRKLLGDPKVVFEVLSPSTSTLDQTVKLNEYRQLGGIQEIVFVDSVSERIRLVRRTGETGWEDDWLQPGEDLHLPSLSLTIPHSAIFASD
jgi:Uma2 family endonuclease